MCIRDRVFADPTDGCQLEANELFLTDTGDVLYNSTDDIGGFQFDVDGATASGGSGGAAQDAGFVVQGAGTTVLGFSFTGGFVPAGCGTLTSLALTGDATGLSGIVFSDPAGVQFDVSYYEGGGDDGGACDDVDEDGICDDVDDCVGAYDECGVCNGDGIADGACDCASNVEDCAGDCGGSAAVDDCGVCGGDGSSCEETTVDVLYSSDTDIYGFQFNVDGADVSLSLIHI